MRERTFALLIAIAASLFISGGLLALGDSAQAQGGGRQVQGSATGTISAQAASVISRTYTLDADFDAGTLINVNHTSPNNHQLQLNAQLTTFPFIWVPMSGRGTVVKINTVTGQILGEYRTAPAGRALNPSRTTVDMKGNVWVGNRDESSNGLGSVAHIGLSENSQCVDRNGNGQIDTSSGLGDIKAWPNAGGADSNGGVSTAQDECIIHYVRVPGTNVRHLSVDRNNNVWAGGYSKKSFSLLDGSTGAVLRTVGPFNCGGYGGLVDSQGIVWSANYGGAPLRLDPATGQGTCLSIPSTNYGLGVDSAGSIWLARLNSNQIYKLNSDGTVASGFPKSSGGSEPRGVAVDANNNVWIAHSGDDTVARLDSTGSLLASISVCSEPIGVAVDAVGKIWVPCRGSNNAVRVNPASNQTDLTVSFGSGANPYTYSDMTGMVALGRTDPQGTWTVVYDSGMAGTPWGTVSWNGGEPSGSSLTVRARSAESTAGLGAAAYISVTSGADIDPPNGRYLQVEVTFRPGAGGVSPVLYDLTIQAAPPPCVITNDKTAYPPAVLSGGPVTITLSMRAVGTCDAAGSPADVMLVLDRSGSMSGDKLTKAKAAANAFAGQMNLTVDQVGVASFASTGQGQLNQQLTQTLTNVTAAINNLQAGGMTNIKEGLEKAEAELTSGRRRAANTPVIILLSDGRHNATAPGELLAAADRIKGLGIRIIAVGLGADADEGQLRAIASSADDYYYAPAAGDLLGIYQSLAPTVRVAGRHMVLTDTLSSYVSLIPGTFQGPVSPTVNGNQIVWNIAAVAATPVTLTYQVALTSTAGSWATNDSALAAYTDAAGQAAVLTFPKPYVTVPAACEQPVVNAIQPAWGFVARNTAVSVYGSQFFTQTDFSTITGTFTVTAHIGPQPLALGRYDRSYISATLSSASGLAAGVYDVSVVNSCAITATLPVDPYTPTVSLPPIPLQTYTGTLPGAFTLYPETRVQSVRPPEGYNDTPADITLCGEGFAPGATAFITTLTGTVDLENQAAYGDTCLAGTVPAGLTPGVYTVTVRSACCDGQDTYRVLDPALNDDLWALPSELWLAPSLAPNSADSITLGLVVSRRGGKDPIENLVVRFYEDDPADANKKIGDGTIPLLSPRVGPSERIAGTSTSAVSWTPSRGVGQYVLYAVIDPANAVAEDIETNNVISRTVQVLPSARIDRVAPRVDELLLNHWPATVTDTTVYTRGIALQVKATDFAQPGVAPSGVARLHFVEYLFSSSANKWVPQSASGWISFTPAVTVTQDYRYTLAPVGGLRFIQAWAADAAGKISRFPNWKTVNYAPPCTRLSRNGAHVYRQTVNAGDTLRVEVAVCSGDADLYIWPPDWQEGQPPFVSNQSGLATEFFEITNTQAGTYQIEVYGFAASTYSLQIEVQPAAGGSRVAGRQVHTAGVDLAKIAPSEPVVPLGRQPPITDSLPPVDFPPPYTEPTFFDVYVPFIVR